MSSFFSSCSCSQKLFCYVNIWPNVYTKNNFCLQPRFMHFTANAGSDCTGVTMATDLTQMYSKPPTPLLPQHARVFRLQPLFFPPLFFCCTENFTLSKCKKNLNLFHCNRYIKADILSFFFFYFYKLEQEMNKGY